MTTTTAITPELIDPALEDVQLPAVVAPEFVGGLNENRVDGIENLANRIMRLGREDYAVPANQLRARPVDGHVELAAFDASDDDPSFKWRVTDYARDQLSTRLSKGLAAFGRDMKASGNLDIYTDAVNELLSRAPSDGGFQVRTIQPNGERISRAIVSTSYKPIDDDLCVPPMLDVIGRSSGKWRALGGQITDRRTHIRLINREPAIRGIGPNNRDWFLGFEYSNSEVGSGKCAFSLFFYDSFCENGCIFGSKSICDVDFVHIGAKIKTNFGVVSDERVLEAEQASIQRLIVEATQNTLTADFAKTVRESMERSESRRLEGDRPTVIRQIAKTVGLNVGETDNVLAHWDSREDNALGVHSAITRLAQDAASFDKRVELEKAGGKVLELTDRQWKSVQALAV